MGLNSPRKGRHRQHQGQGCRAAGYQRRTAPLGGSRASRMVCDSMSNEDGTHHAPLVSRGVSGCTVSQHSALTRAKTAATANEVVQL